MLDDAKKSNVVPPCHTRASYPSPARGVRHCLSTSPSIFTPLDIFTNCRSVTDLVVLAEIATTPIQFYKVPSESHCPSHFSAHTDNLVLALDQCTSARSARRYARFSIERRLMKRYHTRPIAVTPSRSMTYTNRNKRNVTSATDCSQSCQQSRAIKNSTPAPSHITLL